MKTIEPTAIIVRTIKDPRNTLTSIAKHQACFNIIPRIPVVLVYGTCPRSNQARGELGIPYMHYLLPWPSRKWKQIHTHAERLATGFNMPVYLFDDVTQDLFWSRCKEHIQKELTDSLNERARDETIECLNRIFGAFFSFGAQRDKTMLIADLLSSEAVFLFDDDTVLAPRAELIQAHLKLLQSENTCSVFGGVTQPHAGKKVLFRERSQQEQFEQLISDIDGFGASFVQSKDRDFEFKTFGANYCINRVVYQNICCPFMQSTPTTDAELVRYEIRRVLGTRARMVNSGCCLIHQEDREHVAPTAVMTFLRGWAKAKAFWCLHPLSSLLDGSVTEDERRSMIGQGQKEALGAIRTFGQNVLYVSRYHPRRAIGNDRLQIAIQAAAQMLIDYPESVFRAVHTELEEYAALRRCWGLLLKSGKTMDIWTDNQNFYSGRRRTTASLGKRAVAAVVGVLMGSGRRYG